MSSGMSRASVKTASWFPVRARSVKTSAITYRKDGMAQVHHAPITREVMPGDNSRMAAESWRVVIVSTVPKALEPIYQGLCSAGHQPVAVITRPRHGYPGVGAIADLTPPDCDLLVPSSKERLAPLLRACEPDVLLCFAFPWLIPPEALAVQRIGAVNL